MADSKRFRHIIVEEAATTEDFIYPGGGGSDKPLPERVRKTHAERLLSHLEQVRVESAQRKEELKAWAMPAKNGVHVEFESEPDGDLELKSLEDRRQGIQLVAVREPAEAGEPQRAVVFIPKGRLEKLERKIRQYAEEDTPKGQPRHRKMAEKISHIRVAALRSFWTDLEDLLPEEDEAIWWEVWLRSPDEELMDEFRFLMGQLEIEVDHRSLVFPNSRVLLAYGTLQQFSASVEVVDAIAELRRAKEVASLFMEMPRLEQREWVEDLLERTEPPPDEAPRICLLDTGVNAGHPLLKVAIAPEDLHAIDPSWGVDDHHPEGHGTGMAGLALYGDLVERLSGSGLVDLPAWLESVKILPPAGQNEPELYGSITGEAAHRVEVQRPKALRTHLMAVTTQDARDRGRPSSWSAAVDQLAYGGEDGEPKRLWVISAGNSDEDIWSAHPEHLETAEIEDPAQAWNAITVGSSTDRWRIEDADLEGWEPLARPGGLSPSTTTSLTWQKPWPLKPDVVAEGGNVATDGRELTKADSLQLLTTHHQPNIRQFTTFGDTSGASALVAHMAAELRRRYPALWPETIRALIVHSAGWTSEMRQQYGGRGLKGDYERLVRRCGFGVPDLERALWTAENRLTLIMEESIQPFVKKVGRSSCTLKELHIYELPWPVEQLRDLAEIEVELRVTLSYFIEPNPSERGYKYRHRYSSHGYRFDVRGATEGLEDFQKRLNKAARNEEEGSPGTSDTSGWCVGSDARHRGSIHSDIWRGTAADLANRQHIAVFPVSGWWKESPHLNRWRQDARYALVVSIHAPEVEVDLYTPVMNQIGIAIET